MNTLPILSLPLHINIQARRFYTKKKKGSDVNETYEVECILRRPNRIFDYHD